MEQETIQDLFGEQNILCGGMIDLMISAFEVLTEAGYPPQMAYIECIQEAKLIIDLIYAKGFQETNRVISNTAEWGEYVNGPRLITPEVKARMRESLKRIENGEFAKAWLQEVKNGSPNLLAKRAAFGSHPIEAAGAAVREMFQNSGK
jgi:ketol-acid reductoisomerase